ncbi:MAG: hypothetical protein E6K54_08575 [Gammaproteobacteria bacterium]|nr:MAG: hypothetical protein E6K54_08575 [Gammaproteobacteria bacterium]
MKTNSELLLGTWIRDSDDVESIQLFGNVKLHFTADGQLIYTIFDEHKDQKMFLTYRVENNILITDQPSAPREEKTHFLITDEGKLEWECTDGRKARYVRVQPVKTHKTIIYTIPNFAEFVGFYGAHMIWSLEEANYVGPFFCMQKGDEAWFERFESASYEDATAKAKDHYEAIFLTNVDYALLGYDGFLTRDNKRGESLFIQAFERKDSLQDGAILIIIPYVRDHNARSLIIGRIEIYLPRNSSDADKSIFLNNLKIGAHNHTKGFEFWDKHRDRNVEPILIGDY